MVQMYEKIRDIGVIAIYAIPIVCAAAAINASISILKLRDRIECYQYKEQNKHIRPNTRTGLDITNLS